MAKGPFHDSFEDDFKDVVDTDGIEEAKALVKNHPRYMCDDSVL